MLPDEQRGTPQARQWRRMPLQGTWLQEQLPGTRLQEQLQGTRLQEQLPGTWLPGSVEPRVQEPVELGPMLPGTGRRRMRQASLPGWMG